MTWSAIRSCGALALATACCLLPFSGRAFHVDDPLFVWAAQNIAKHPLDPYGFQITWDVVPQRMAEITQNPPLSSYYAGLVGSVFGWSERALHLGFLLITVMLVVGIWRLSRSFTKYPSLAALASLLTPALIVSACSVMCDVMMLTLWVWAVVFWVKGMNEKKRGLMVAAMFLVGLAALTKYFAISLIPLLAVYSSLRTRRLGMWLLYFVVPIAMVVGYELWTEKLYGHGLLLSAARFSAAQRASMGTSWSSMVIAGLSFAGGCTLIALTFTPMLWSRFTIASVLLLSTVGTVAISRGWFGQSLQVTEFGARQHWLSIDLQLTVCIAAGILLLCVALSDLDLHDADSSLLRLWLLGTFVFACFLNYTVNARSILPLVPAASILVVRRLEKKNPDGFQKQFGTIGAALAVAGIVALIVAGGDTGLANSQRRAAEIVVKRTEGQFGTLWFEGHWGFQYYMERAGARPLNVNPPEMNARDALVIPHNNIHLKPIGMDRSPAPQELDLQPRGWASTIDPWDRASFYSSYWGPLPYYIGLPHVERYSIVQFANAGLASQ